MCLFCTVGVNTVVVSVKYNCMHILVSLKFAISVFKINSSWLLANEYITPLSNVHGD